MRDIRIVDGDCYESDPHCLDICFCGICGAEMDAERDIPPSGGFAGAMAGHNRSYDRFQCKHRQEDWHSQAKALKREIAKTPSKKIADLMQKELDGIIQTKTPTK